VHERLRPGGVAADRNGHLADAEGVEHVELPRCEGEAAGARGRVDLEGEGVVELAHDALDRHGLEPERRRGERGAGGDHW
jgi:hypothetical protein